MRWSKKVSRDRKTAVFMVNSIAVWGRLGLSPRSLSGKYAVTAIPALAVNSERLITFVAKIRLKYAS